MKNNIVDRSFYLTSIFADMKSDHTWTTNEEKLTFLVFEKLSDHRMFFKKDDSFDDLLDEIRKNIKNVPLQYTLSKEDFRLITGIKKEHLAREIKKTAKGLLSKYVMTPHPLNPKDEKSFKGFTWFTDIEYINSSNHITIKINESAIDRLIAFVHYTEINFKNLINVKNHNAIKTYIAVKIILDSSRKQTKILDMEISEFKSKIGLKDKYRNHSEFKKYVLDVIKREVNDFTDINLDYELVKEGRSFSRIRLIFDYKDQYIEQKTNLLSEKVFDKDIKLDDNIKNKPLPSGIEAILVSWGIKKEPTIKEWSIEYSHEAFQKSIDITLDAISKGSIKKSPAAYFKGVLENKKWEEKYLLEKQKEEVEKEQKRNEKVIKDKEYDNLCSFIFSNENAIASAITTHTKCLPITDHEVKSIFEEIKKIDADKYRGYETEVISFYHFEAGKKAPLSLSEVVDWANIIKVNNYKNDLETIEAYKQAYEKLKGLIIFQMNKKNSLKKKLKIL
ncbi:replication initiation protein [Francisella tularensis]|uniref:replication initiation protein n=1 Tax=Francisella tularensis TaxID=263 RepID=UPI000504CC34|nr:replication initiation protein [Francisella tularensis]KFJ70266.1 initiator Replication family protein [Francisella tularensis subsp. novicida]